MAKARTEADTDRPGAEVLTLPEVADYLRVPEEAIVELAERKALPARRVGGEWRFLKDAVAEWLRFGADFPREFWLFPPWMPEHPLWEKWFRTLEERILNKVSAAERADPGSKQAVLRHFGVFQDDADLDEQLAAIRSRREAAGE
jgi:excisionase family DNA binding protein